MKISIAAILIVSFTATICRGNPIQESLTYQELDGLVPVVQENVVLTQELELALSNGTARTMECSTDDFSISPMGLRDPRYRWQNFNVFIDPAFSTNERNLINNAMYRLYTVIPCVRFAIWQPGSNPTGDYVRITKGSGCSSAVGKRGGSQGMSLGNGCMHMRIILHEMIHALGFHHEMSRPDRDSHVNIHFENIRPGAEHNFRKLGDDYVTSFGVPYNQNSIMHYGGTDFSRNGRPTITAKNGRQVGPISEDLQNSDIEKLKRMYNC